jgi:2,3-dihydroxybenzoate-AMP ligase
VIESSKVTPFPPDVVARYRADGYWGSRTIGAELRQMAARHPDVEALVTQERRLTYSELDARTDAIAQRLLDLGLRAGDPVILQVGNTAETVEALYAMIKMGAVPVCSLVPFGHHEIDAIADIVGARAHLVQADLGGRDLVAFAREVRDVVPTMELVLTIRGEGKGADRIDDAKPLDSPPGDFGVDDADAVAVMQLSGGTTGTPKAIPRLHAEYWYNGRATAERFGIRAGDRVAHFLPIVHNAGIHAALFPAHSVGATLVLGTTWTPTTVLEILRDERVTHFGTMTSLIASIADDPVFAAATQHVRRLSLAMPAVPGELFDSLTAKGLTVCQFFGMSEGFGTSMASDAAEEMRRETVGFPFSEADEVVVLDPSTDLPVEEGGVGELCVRGPYTLRGYYNAPEHNAAAFTADGFLRTGDMVRPVVIDGHTCLQVAGRKKDLISRGGEKINASEIENLLVQIPTVQSAALVGMADPRLGERACAFLVTEDDSRFQLDVVKDFLSARGVAKYKWPERLEFIGALPVTAVGKVSKVTLRELLDQRLAEN